MLLALVVSVPVFVLIGFSIYDVVRRDDLPAGRRMGWLAAVVMIPALGTLIYLIARPFPDPAERAETSAGSVALVGLLVRRERGEIDADTFAAAIAQILGASGPN